MSADWTTCRVVRDHDGDLWGHDSHGWNLLGEGSDSCLTTDLLSEFGPIAPVLDADGLPVVTTVGDLTARHIGRRVRVKDWFEGNLLAMPAAGRFEVRLGPRATASGTLALDTPCEVLA